MPIEASEAAQPSDTPAGPNPFSEALFLDVPYVIDSLFRWAEFRANRIGLVDFAKPEDFVRRAAWTSPLFGLYLFITLFLVFGPTFRSLCGVLGKDGMSRATGLVAAIMIALCVVIGLSLLSHVLRTLTRRLRLERQVVIDPGKPQEAAAIHSTSGSRRPISTMVRGWLAQLREVLRELGDCFGQLTCRGWLRVSLALLVLLLVIAGALAPLIAAAKTAAEWTPTDVGCFKVPDPAGIWAQLAALLLVAVGGLWIWSNKGIKRPHQQLWALLALWAVSIAALWLLFVHPTSREASPGPYAHVYPIVVLALCLIALGAFWLARVLFGNPQVLWVRIKIGGDGEERIDWAKRYGERLKTTPLIRNLRPDPPVQGIRIAAAFVNGIGAHPLQALLLPALVAMSFPTEGLLTYTAISFAIGATLLAYGNLSTRWQQLVLYIDRWFLIGAPLPVSVVVIVVGALRLLDVQYVSTVLDAAPFGTIIRCLVMLYLAAWFFEYWLNHWPGMYLLAGLGAPLDEHGDVIRLPDEVAGDPPELGQGGRYLSLHGSGRVCAQGWFERAHPAAWEKKRDSAFTTYEFLELFRHLSRPDDDPDVIDSLQRRVRLYFYTANTVLALAAALLWYQHTLDSRPLVSDPVIVAHVTPPAENEKSNLLTALERQGKEPALIIAASGGGTRAALYTAYALQGLARLHRTQDIVLLSGVSGGGVAAAVFAQRSSKLATGDPDGRDWRGYIEDLAQPFIEDVLDGLGELRIARAAPLGVLLSESFTHRLFEDQAIGLGSFSGPLLILNTSVTGHPADEADLLRGRAAVPPEGGDLQTQCNERSRPFSLLSGGRLAFTTLNSDAGFPTKVAELPDVRFDFTLLRPDGTDPAKDIPMAAAAALNANFPPVFPNARVRVFDQRYDPGDGCDRRSFFVTDGGATENLGLVSALFALRGAIRQAGPAKLPPIHLLAIEASAVTYDYTEDRGIGAATGGSKERVTGALTQELLDDIRARLAARNMGEQLVVHYLPLPVAFRSRGGLGTHWMFARTFRVADPLLARMPNRFLAYWQGVGSGQPRYETLEQKDVGFLWQRLFAPQGAFCASPLITRPDPSPSEARIQQVQNWICGHERWDDDVAKPDWQVEAWQATVASLQPPGTP
jgi:hypothetical protein